MTLFHLGKTSELALRSTSTTFYIMLLSISLFYCYISVSLSFCCCISFVFRAAKVRTFCNMAKFVFSIR